MPMLRKLALISVGVIGLVGCQRDPPTYPVSGKVQFPSGAPVRMGTVETRSQELGVHARGTIESDGSFSLTTFRPGDGAVAGIHDCVVVQLVVAEGFDGKVSTYGVVDPKHNSYRTSGLTLEVKPDQTNEVVLEVTALRGQEADEKDHKH